MRQRPLPLLVLQQLQNYVVPDLQVLSPVAEPVALVQVQAQLVVPEVVVAAAVMPGQRLRPQYLPL